MRNVLGFAVLALGMATGTGLIQGTIPVMDLVRWAAGGSVALGGVVAGYRMMNMGRCGNCGAKADV